MLRAWFALSSANLPSALLPSAFLPSPLRPGTFLLAVTCPQDLPHLRLELGPFPYLVFNSTGVADGTGVKDRDGLAVQRIREDALSVSASHIGPAQVFRVDVQARLSAI
ncbi:MAG TPA: hypothetical protein H9871_00250, partial [Candidatus Nesterenkonia stercoripullorum]|nr:hypothetical protein [Candidatus Nesterenkonia stercoripullorum]